MVSHGEHGDGGGSNGGGGHSDGHVLVILGGVVIGGIIVSWSFFNWGKVGRGNTGNPGPGGVGVALFIFGNSDVTLSGSLVVESACQCIAGFGDGRAAPVVGFGLSGINGGIASGLAISREGNITVHKVLT